MTINKDQFDKIMDSLASFGQAVEREFRHPKKDEHKARPPITILSEPLMPSDICIIGLALCRLEEAADDYVQSSGWSERSTFPSTKNNINQVRRVQERAGQLRLVIAKLHSEIEARALVYGSPGSPEGDKK